MFATQLYADCNKRPPPPKIQPPFKRVDPPLAKKGRILQSGRKMCPPSVPLFGSLCFHICRGLRGGEAQYLTSAPSAVFHSETTSGHRHGGTKEAFSDVWELQRTYESLELERGGLERTRTPTTAFSHTQDTVPAVSSWEVYTALSPSLE